MAIHAKILRSGCVAALAMLGAGTAMTSGPAQAADQDAWTHEAACQTLQMAATGGPAPSDPNVFVMRYMGSSNYELSYRGTVLLFDAQYRRSEPFRLLPVTREQLTHVNALYIGHGHADHMQDAPFIAQQDNVPMYGAWVTTAAATKMGLPDKLNITVKNGDVQKYPGFQVETVLAYHSITRDPDGQPNKAFVDGGKAWVGLKNATGLVLSPEEQARRAALGVQGSNDGQHILTEGTMAWFVTFDDGYKVVILDSSGPVTPGEEAMMKRIGHANLAIVAYQGFFVPSMQVPKTMPLIEEFKPDVFMPDHHDQTAGGYPDMAVEPLFMAIREKMPATRTISPEYGTPICFNTKTRDVFVGETWAQDKNAK